MKKLLTLTQILGTTLFLTMSLISEAAVYDLAHFPFSYSNSINNAQGAIETTQTGTFTKESEIEDFFNNSTYFISFAGVSLSNANSYWDLDFSYEPDVQTTSAILNVTNNRITLDFSTPTEFTEVRLIARGTTSSGSLNLQYAQSNNIDNRNYVIIDHDAMDIAETQLSYGTQFVLPAAISAVSEPETYGMMWAGLGLIGYLTRRRIV